MTYEEALSYIHSICWKGSKLGLDRTRELLGKLGDPQKELKFIHIAGTNGKGSTAAMLSSILEEAGYRVGLYTSPFIDRFNERMQVDHQPIPDDTLAELTALVRPYADGMADSPTEFELITALAMVWFAREKCDIVVLEVGMGGEFDATNAIPCPEVAVLTSIGLDHTAVLGPTVADIARTKSGIIKEGGDVVSYGHLPEADAEIEAACRRSHARLWPVDFDLLMSRSVTLEGRTFDYGPLKELKIPLLANYQPKNAAVAVTALSVLAHKGWHITEQHIRAGFAAVQWPGRFEVLGNHPVFLLDGSHNPQGIAATADSLRELFPEQKFVFLLSIMADKDVDTMLSTLAPLAQQCFTVAADNPRATPPAVLTEKLQELGCQAESCASIPEAVAAAQGAAGYDGRVCALGTLYFSGDVRRAFFRSL